MSAPSPLVGTVGPILGQECIMTIGIHTVAALLRGTTPNFTYASQPKMTAGPQSTAGSGSPAADQSLMGYSPSTGARSGFTVDFQLPYANTVSILTDCLDGAGKTILLQFGSAGAYGNVSIVGVDTCIAEQLEITGSEGGDIEVRGTFQSIALPVQTATPATSIAAYTDYWRFLDVTSVTTPGNSATPRTDVSSFSFRITRQLAAYRGNSPTGIPKHLRIARTECFLDCTYMLMDSLESGVVIDALPLATADAKILLTREQPLTGSTATAATLTLTCLSAFTDTYPTTQGDWETYILEALALKSSNGTYTIA
jgi:hypothetical protein